MRQAISLVAIDSFYCFSCHHCINDCFFHWTVVITTPDILPEYLNKR